MNSNCTNTTGASDHLSMDESRELLTEVRCATEDSPQSNLFGFAGLLCQLIDLAERVEDDGIANHVSKGIDEIRSVMDADQSTSQQLESLQQEAIDQWGDQLTPMDDFADPCDDTVDAWAMSADHDSTPDHDPDDPEDLVAPSADEISSLLTQLGNVSPQPAPTANPDASAVPAENLDSDSDAPASPKAANASMESINTLDPELKEAFLDDASSCVSSMEDALLRLDADPKDADSLNQILRELHTLKGASASVGLSELADHLHHLEDNLRDDQSAGRAPAIDVLLQSVDAIRSQISGDDSQSPPTPPSPQNQPAQGVSPTASPTAGPAPAHATAKVNAFADGPADDESVRVKSSQLNRLMDMLAELVMLRNRRETELSELQDVYHELIGSVSKMRLLSNEGQIESAASKSLQLSEVANDVLEAAQHLRDCARPVAEGNAAVSGFIRQFRQELVELRRTPVSGLFKRLQRVVRDAAQAESKEVRLQLVGEEAGIERSLQQRLYEPLLHIVRNAVCHGIESPEDRQRSGKESAGTITLEAIPGTEMFVIEIRDDGRGLDYDAIRRRGVEKGLLAADQVASRQELSQLIFHPGFSTRQTANQVAGRGVGMDVVASTLQRMRGWLEVNSDPGRGTCIRLSFPLPSVIQHAMVFRSAGQLFALPMQSVQTAGKVAENSVCLVFSDLLGRSRENAPESFQQIVLTCENNGHNSANDSTPVTLLVDEIVGPEELVVRPMPSLMKQHPFCVGATLSGMGQTVLLLDGRRVVQSQSDSLSRSAEMLRGYHASSSSQARPRVLVVDDSLSARKRVVRSLSRYSVEIVEASDGKEALEILKRDSFAAIFSDMEMPHVSGMELLAEVNSGSDPAPVVIISSRGEDEFTSRARQLGANNYLIKPLADEALDAALEGIESLRHLKSTSASTLQPIGEIQ